MATNKTKRKQIEQTEAKAVLDSVKDINLQTVVNEVSNLQITVQKTLADLCATVTNKVQQVEQLDTAIELKDARLQELYNIEKEAISLDEMRAQKEEERLAWEKARQENNARVIEEAAALQKQRQREQEQYTYEFEQRKKRSQEEFDAEVNRNKRNEQIRHETLEKGWLERENALKAKEGEFTRLANEVASFPGKLNDAVKAAESKVTRELSGAYDHQIALLKKDAESAKALADMRVVALNEQITGLQSQIEELHAQLLAARQDAKEVASEALKSASSRQLAETLQKVVTENQPAAKNK